ncbi:hypothetical protein CF15_03185 [Pyrodictium occultum]|uniref:Uncharacterized protein n=1 Tax=Pyrodictium occultum TaxID=2309 RepID=A0A0V8RUS5_PYROC|nr:hypothetical protein [Pyrodictium occultum]KSW11820.1 hypothetical protein CF15_03185 [Pyrodictium occultum]
MASTEEIRRILEPLARRRGYSISVEGGSVWMLHPEAPFYVEARPTGQGVLVRVGYRGLRDYVRELVDSVADPRSVLEDVLDEVAMVAHEAYTALRGAGIAAKLEAREAVLDALEELEEAEEEE